MFAHTFKVGDKRTVLDLRRSSSVLGTAKDARGEVLGEARGDVLGVPLREPLGDFLWASCIDKKALMATSAEPVNEGDLGLPPLGDVVCW